MMDATYEEPHTVRELQTFPNDVKLHPCPTCGGDHHVLATFDPTILRWLAIQCGACGFRFNSKHSNTDFARMNWNINVERASNKGSPLGSVEIPPDVRDLVMTALAPHLTPSQKHTFETMLGT